MKIAILSRNRSLHSIRRLTAEAAKLGVKCDVIDPLECQLIVDGRRTRVVVGTQELPEYDAVLPRIGASITEYGIAVVRHLESLGVCTVNRSQAIADSRDKMRCLQILAEAGLRVPITVLCRSPKSLKKALEAVHGVPVILKLLQGTQGVGVMLVHSPASLQSVLDTLNTLEQDVIIQEFLRESAGRDYRAVVVGGVVVASMMRQAPQGEFRSNIHRGGAGVAIKLPPAYERAAIRAASVVGLRIAGVDLMETPSGPAVIEVNSSPGFEGIERSTGKNVAIHLMKQVIREARLHARSQRIKRQKKLQRKRK